jgi:RimJ/RimL family protein N-acetyltransferase
MTFNEAFPPDLSIETSLVKLRTVQDEDIPVLRLLASEPSIWKYFSAELHIEGETERWFANAAKEYTEEKRIAFTIIDKASGEICGSTSYGNISLFDKRIEIGWTWLGTAFQGSHVNSHAKFALLRYAFETINMERVEIKTDDLNDRAKRAIEKVGFTFEGVFRSHMQMPHGRRRNSAYFSLLQHEWPDVKQRCFQPMELS